jgi:hypothetical protein
VSKRKRWPVHTVHGPGIGSGCGHQHTRAGAIACAVNLAKRFPRKPFEVYKRTKPKGREDFAGREPTGIVKEWTP